MPITFITTVTNNAYLPFVRAHLESIYRHHPDAAVLVYHDRLTTDRVVGLCRQFPGANFVAAVSKNYRSTEETIGGKMASYCRAVELVPPGSELVLIDCDTLLCAPLDELFDDEFDLCFTWKEDGFPLNSGVVLARMNEPFRTFLDSWNELTQSILHDPTRLALAVTRAGFSNSSSAEWIVGVTRSQASNVSRATPSMDSKQIPHLAALSISTSFAPCPMAITVSLPSQRTYSAFCWASPPARMRTAVSPSC
jgi:hypothetical protein